MADLKKCPFCGSEANFWHIFENPDKCMVGCRGCDVVIDGVFPNELEAAKKWNDQVLADEIAALRAENERYKADIEAGRLVRLPCGVGDTVYELWYSPCHDGETYPDSLGCCGCEDECDMKRVVRPVQFCSIQQILAHWSGFESGWYYTTEEAARAALEGGQHGSATP